MTLAERERETYVPGEADANIDVAGEEETDDVESEDEVFAAHRIPTPEAEDGIRLSDGEDVAGERGLFRIFDSFNV